MKSVFEKVIFFKRRPSRPIAMDSKIQVKNRWIRCRCRFKDEVYFRMFSMDEEMSSIERKREE